MAENGSIVLCLSCRRALLTRISEFGVARTLHCISCTNRNTSAQHIHTAHQSEKQQARRRAFAQSYRTHIKYIKFHYQTLFKNMQISWKFCACIFRYHCHAQLIKMHPFPPNFTVNLNIFLCFVFLCRFFGVNFVSFARSLLFFSLCLHFKYYFLRCRLEFWCC